FALRQGFDYLPVPGERDIVWESGLGVPLAGRTLDVNYSHKKTRNILAHAGSCWRLDVNLPHKKTKNLVDHEVLGNSSLLFPLTIDNGRVRAFESTLRSPKLDRRLTVHYALSVMTAQGRGAVTGGLTDFSPPSDAYFYLDHDQRVTL